MRVALTNNRMRRDGCDSIGNEPEQEISSFARFRSGAHDRAIVLAQDLE
jgi:hypothetical protein